MNSIRWHNIISMAGAVLVLAAHPCFAQFQAEKLTLKAEEKQALTEGCDHLRKELQSLRMRETESRGSKTDPLPDVEIFLDAVERNLQEDLFFSAANVQQARSCLAEGEVRAAALKDGKSPWTRQTGVVVLGYRSALDGSAQPYQIYIPSDYDFTARKPIRLDLFLHGRGGNLNEPAFIRGTGWVKGNFGGENPHNLALYPYGRGNNGWRYAGEQDVFEAMADCKRRYPIDENRVVLRGFSMGGHGAWHIGLQHPGVWAAISPGAGFVETIRYHNIKEPLPNWQKLLLHLSDPLDYAANARNVPVMPYVGETDTFYSQHQIMDAMLKQENAPYQEFIGPKTGHRYEQNTLKMLLEALAPVHREPYSARVDFITYTLRFPECKWVKVEGLEQHWQRAEVHAYRPLPHQIEVHTHNVTALHLTPEDWKGGMVAIDSQQVAVSSGGISLIKRGKRWATGEGKGLRKLPGLTGPIDDALFSPILVVAGTGAAWNERAQHWADQERGRFRAGWGLYCRGTLPETTDVKLTAVEIKGKNLYLFGDPGSIAVLRRLLPKLPILWSRDTITVAGKSFSARDHLPLLIFPNPESPMHYVVLNIGFTFSQSDMDGSNSQQYPHLPDYAVIHFDSDHFTDDRSNDVELVGFFDENWRVIHK